MNRKIAANVNTIMALTMAMEPGASMMFTGRGDDFEQVYPPIPREPMPPHGTKTYWFNSNGDFSSAKMRKDETVFSCFAINDKNAVRKYNKWKSNNPEGR